MRYVAVLIACVACAVPAQATVDPDIDQIGVYFDLNADEVCLEAVDLFSMFSAYLIITNPSASDIIGIDVCLRAEGFVQELGYDWYVGWIGVDWFENGYRCMGYGFNEPVPFDGLNFPLARINYMVVGEGGAAFYLDRFPDSFPTYYDSGGNAYPLGFSSGDRDLPVAVVTRECGVVSTSHATFGSVKSLYR